MAASVDELFVVTHSGGRIPLALSDEFVFGHTDVTYLVVGGRHGKSSYDR